MGIEIRIFAPVTAEHAYFERLGITQLASSISTTTNLSSPGHFSVAIPVGALHADKLREGCLLLIDRLFWGIVDSVNFDATEMGEMLTVSGSDLKGVTAGWITLPPQSSGAAAMHGYDAKQGSTETVMQHFVNVNMIDTFQPQRHVHGLLLAPDQGRGLPDDRYASRHDNLARVLQELADASGLGYDIIPDLEEGAYIFDVIQGLDRSGNQSDRPRVVFDLSRGTAQAQTYQSSRQDARNAFYATMSGAEFADEALTMMYIRDGEEEQAGLFRREQHLTISAETPTAGDEYNELRRYALIEAEQFRPAESFDCVIIEDRLRYGVDYFVGDTVTVQHRGWGITMHPMLMSMTTDYTAAGITRQATFGKAPLNVFGRLRQQMRGGL